MRIETAKQHLSILGWLYVGMGALTLLAALVVFIAVVGGGLLSGDAEARAVTSVTGVVIAAVLLLLAVPGIIAGLGLLKYLRWSKPLGLVLGFFNLFNFPVGTVLGVYTFWVLLREETDRVLVSGGRTPPSNLNGPFFPRAPV